MIILWITSIDMWKTLQAVHRWMMIFLFSSYRLILLKQSQAIGYKLTSYPIKTLLNHPAQQGTSDFSPNCMTLQSAGKLLHSFRAILGILREVRFTTFPVLLKKPVHRILLGFEPVQNDFLGGLPCQLIEFIQLLTNHSHSGYLSQNREQGLHPLLTLIEKSPYAHRLRIT